MELLDQYGIPLKIERRTSPTPRALTGQRGSGGIGFISGAISSDEFNADLEGQSGILQYDKMRRTDAQIQALLFALQLPILSATFEIVDDDGKPGNSPPLKFAKETLFKENNWDQFLRHVLSCLWAGYSWFEKVYELQEDDKLHLLLKPCLASTLSKWWTDTKDELIGIEQEVTKNGKTQHIDIPRYKIVLFTYQQEANNYSGMSVLRGVNKHFLIKDSVYRVDAIRIERFALGVPHFELPEVYTEKLKDDLVTIGKNWKAGAQSYLITPAGVVVNILSMSESQALDVLPTIQHHNEEMGKAALTQFINLGSTNTGSRNLGDSMQKFFYDAEKALGNWIVREINEQIIWPTLDLNFPNKPRPTLKVSNIGAISLAAIMEALLKGRAYITPDDVLEDHLRDALGLPKRDPKTAHDASTPTTLKPRVSRTAPTEKQDVGGMPDKKETKQKELSELLTLLGRSQIRVMVGSKTNKISPTEIKEWVRPVEKYLFGALNSTDEMKLYIHSQVLDGLTAAAREIEKLVKSYDMSLVEADDWEGEAEVVMDSLAKKLWNDLTKPE